MDKICEQMHFNINTAKVPRYNKSIKKSDIQKLYEETVRIKEEIIIRTGHFYADNNTDLKLTDIESLLLTRYEAGEITHKQLKKIIEKYKLNIPFINSEDKFAILLNRISPFTSYSHYNTDTEKEYYDIVESEDLSYENTIETVWATEDEYTSKQIKDIKNLAKKHTFKKDDITIGLGSDANAYSQICIYRGKKLIGHFHEDSEYYNDIVRLFEYENVDKSCLTLADSLSKELTLEKQKENKKQFDKFKKKAKYIFQKNNECYMLQDKIYTGMGDTLLCFLNYKLVYEYNFEYGHTMGTLEFEEDIVKDIPLNTISKGAKKKKIKLKYLNEMIQDLDMFAFKYKKKKDAEEKEKYESYQESYKQYNYDSLFDDKDTYTDSEKIMLKKIYKTLAVKFHPDMPGGDENIMQLINKLKEEWGI